MQEDNRMSIDPYYKKGNVFERDEAYYSQMLGGTRRTNLRNSSRGNSQPRNINDRSAPPPINTANDRSERIVQSTTYDINVRQERTSKIIEDKSIKVSANNDRQLSMSNNDRQYSDAVATNTELKLEMERIISGNTDFGLSDNVVKLSHYNFSQGDLGKIKEQEKEIRRLEELSNANVIKLQKFKKGGEELSLRVNNIQSIDKQIYKTLQGSVNRDKELLDRASSALARGERREDIAKVLQQIIG